MADIAAVVGTFLTLTTEWYKNTTAHNTASATLLHHLRNLNQFQVHIKDSIDSLFRLYRPRADHQQLDPLLLFQAVRVVHLNASLQDWLYDAGFRPAKRSEVVVVNRRARGSAAPQSYFIKRRQSGDGQLSLPRFGVTSKESAFVTLFERLERAYEKVEAAYPHGAYRFIPVSPWTLPPPCEQKI